MTYSRDEKNLKPDFKTHCIVLLLRMVRLFRGVPQIDKVRKLVDKMEARAEPALPDGITRQEETISDVPVTRLTNQNAKTDKVVLYLHGGGMCLRMPNMEITYISAWSERLGANAVLPWYRLAPEDKHPAGIEDCYAVYRALLDSGQNPSSIVLSGMSAGGGYALAVLAMIKADGLPMPGAAVLLSPSGDSIMVGQSWIENYRRDPLFTTADILHFRGLAIDPDDFADPLINVSLMPSFEDYPPMYFAACSTELLRDVSTMAAEKAVQAGVECQVDILQGGFHGIQAIMGTRQAKFSWQRIDQFLQKHLSV